MDETQTFRFELLTWVMSDTLASPRHLDGSIATYQSDFINVKFQHGDPLMEGVNGCRIDDVLDLLVEKLLDFQGRSLSCQENERALYHLGLAKEALNLRRKFREQQGLLGTAANHVSEP